MSPEPHPGPFEDAGPSSGVPSSDAPPSYRAPGVMEEPEPRTGFLPGVLRFFVVPLVLVGASVGVFAVLGAVVNSEPSGPHELIRAIAEGGKNARWQAAQEISNLVHRGDLDLRRDESLTAALAEALERARATGDDPRVIQHLAVLLGRGHPVPARPALERALADGEPDVRIFALAALAELGEPGSLEAASHRLRDLDPAVRAMAAYAVPALMAKGGVEDAAAREAVAGVLGDPEVDVRWNAALGLARLGDPAGAEVIWGMIHRDHVRPNLRSGDPGAGGGFLAPRGADPDSAADREDRVVLNALSAVYRLKDRSMLPGVRELAAADPSPAVQSWAMKTQALLEEEVRSRGAVPERSWTAARRQP